MGPCPAAMGPSSSVAAAEGDVLSAGGSSLPPQLRLLAAAAGMLRQALAALMLLIAATLGRQRQGGARLAGSASIQVDLSFEYQPSRAAEAAGGERVQAAVSTSTKASAGTLLPSVPFCRFLDIISSGLC